MSGREQAAKMLRMAMEDLAAIEEFRRSAGITDAIFGFHAQQAVEKALKAWLLQAGRGYPKIHDLEELFGLLADAGQSVPPEFRRLDYLTAFAAQFRYMAADDLDVHLDREGLVREVAAVVEHVKRLIEES